MVKVTGTVSKKIREGSDVMEAKGLELRRNPGLQVPDLQLISGGQMKLCRVEVPKVWIIHSWGTQHPFRRPASVIIIL